ncbi:hypothetical protein L6Q21_05530, partial [Sandaracinobacter sp. RS1-74]|nr:hypothetical protein [Sandaracinobacteroides sayramensis]
MDRFAGIARLRPGRCLWLRGADLMLRRFGAAAPIGRMAIGRGTLILALLLGSAPVLSQESVSTFEIRAFQVRG